MGRSFISAVFVTLHFILVGLTIGSTNNGYPLSKILAKLLQARRVDRFRIGEVTTSSVPSTTAQLPPGCQHEGQYFPPNTEIYSGEDRDNNWCYGAVCDQHGQVLHWDDFNCFSTSQPTTSTTPTTSSPPPSTTPPVPPGCQYGGQHYPPNSEIYNGEDRANNWCYGAYCDERGHVLEWDNFDCFSTTTESTTATTPASSTQPPAPPINTNINNWLSRLRDRLSSLLNVSGSG